MLSCLPGPVPFHEVSLLRGSILLPLRLPKEAEPIVFLMIFAHLRFMSDCFVFHLQRQIRCFVRTCISDLLDARGLQKLCEGAIAAEAKLSPTLLASIVLAPITL